MRQSLSCRRGLAGCDEVWQHAAASAAYIFGDRISDHAGSSLEAGFVGKFVFPVVDNQAQAIDSAYPFVDGIIDQVGHYPAQLRSVKITTRNR